MAYYRLVLTSEERWCLSVEEHFLDGTALDVWRYSNCELIEAPAPVPVSVYADGNRMDYNPTAFGVTVVSRRLGQLLESAAPEDVQRIPAILDAGGDWEVLNILSCVDCIDHQRSIITYFPLDHPEKPGKPRMVVKMIVDPKRVGRNKVFRAKDWMVVEIVSEGIKGLLEANGITGVEYWPVTDDVFGRGRKRDESNY